MKKREVRHKVSVAAEMRLEGKRVGVRVLNISARGMLVRCSAAPERGDYVEITRASERVIGRVIWSRGDKFGLRAQDRIDINAFIDAVVVGTACGSCGEGHESAADRPSQTIEQSLAHSQRLSTIMQFGFLAVAGIAAAALLATSVHDLLSASFGEVAHVLSGEK